VLVKSDIIYVDQIDVIVCGEYLWGGRSLHPVVKRGGGSSMTVGGCMAVSGVGNLHLIGGIMNKHVCKHCLRSSDSQC
jgi:hypothetical protein